MPHPLDSGIVLITGASSGIGREIALEMSGRAKGIALAARRKDRLTSLAEELRQRKPDLQVSVHQCDVTNHARVDEMLAEVLAAHQRIDVLVNNAGVGDVGVFDMSDWSKTEQLIALNVTSL